MVVGLTFFIQNVNPTPELWKEAKRRFVIERLKQIGGGYNIIVIFWTIQMPCGEIINFARPRDIMGLPIMDIPCPCGDKSHWLVKFEVMNG